MSETPKTTRRDKLAELFRLASELADSELEELRGKEMIKRLRADTSAKCLVGINLTDQRVRVLVDWPKLSPTIVEIAAFSVDLPRES